MPLSYIDYTYVQISASALIYLYETTCCSDRNFILSLFTHFLDHSSFYSSPTIKIYLTLSRSKKNQKHSCAGNSGHAAISWSLSHTLRRSFVRSALICLEHPLDFATLSGFVGFRRFAEDSTPRKMKALNTYIRRS